MIKGVYVLQSCPSRNNSTTALSSLIRMESVGEVEQTGALGALLDAGDGDLVTLVAGETRLAAHRAVLVDRSPVFAAMFGDDTPEASSGHVISADVEDVEGAVLRELLAYLYTRQAPQLPGMAPQLLVAADKYGVSGLKAACEQQVEAQLSVETAAGAAVLAVRHSCGSLRQAAVHFIKVNPQVMATQGWAGAVRTQPEDVIEIGRLLADPPADPPADIRMESVEEVKQTGALGLGALLDAGDAAVVTLVAGDTRLAVHRAVLVDRSPVFAAMFSHDTLEASSGLVTIPDVEGTVLRELVSYLYTRQAPQLPGMAPQLLAAADKYGVWGLKAACEQQVEAQLSVETAAAAAVLAVRHSCGSLRQAAVDFIKAHNYEVMATQGWAVAIRTQPEDVIEISRLLADPPADKRSLRLEKGRRLLQAAKEGAAEQLAALLAAGADVEATDGGGWTALHWAARRGHVEAARQLVARGAALGAKGGCRQQTPLHCAAVCGHAAVVRLLLAASADHSARDLDGCTPLHWAAKTGHTEVAVALLEAGADGGATDTEGRTPLDWACQGRNRQQMVDLLTGR